jgi:hypothetical protein
MVRNWNAAGWSEAVYEACGGRLAVVGVGILVVGYL